MNRGKLKFDTLDVKVCDVCGGEFFPKNSLHKRCSQICSKEYWNKAVRVETSKINCHICGKLFTTSRNIQKYCSDECFAKNVSIKYHKTSSVVEQSKYCKNCNVLFKFRQSLNVQEGYKRVFCTKACKRSLSKKIRKQELADLYKTGNLDLVLKLNGSFLKIRFEILKRDNFTCQYCGRSPSKDGCKLHVDHIIPKSAGGKDLATNFITSCLECNFGKGKDVLLNKRIELKSKTEETIEHDKDK